MYLTQALLNRLPDWTTEGWQVGDTVNLGDFGNRADAIADRILNNDASATFFNEHPPHKPS